MSINWRKEYARLLGVSEQLLENIDGLKIHSRGALAAFKNGVNYGRDLEKVFIKSNKKSFKQERRVK